MRDVGVYAVACRATLASVGAFYRAASSLDLTQDDPVRPHARPLPTRYALRRFEPRLPAAIAPLTESSNGTSEPPCNEWSRIARRLAADNCVRLRRLACRQHGACATCALLDIRVALTRLLERNSATLVHVSLAPPFRLLSLATFVVAHCLGVRRLIVPRFDDGDDAVTTAATTLADSDVGTTDILLFDGGGGGQRSSPTGGGQRSSPTGGGQRSSPTGGGQRSSPTGGGVGGENALEEKGAPTRATVMRGPPSAEAVATAPMRPSFDVEIRGRVRLRKIKWAALGRYNRLVAERSRKNLVALAACVEPDTDEELRQWNIAQGFLTRRDMLMCTEAKLVELLHGACVRACVRGCVGVCSRARCTCPFIFFFSSALILWCYWFAGSRVGVRVDQITNTLNPSSCTRQR
jgi:hypothetical protein